MLITNIIMHAYRSTQIDHMVSDKLKESQRLQKHHMCTSPTKLKEGVPPRLKLRRNFSWYSML
jgi:hypothetical protein